MANGRFRPMAASSPPLFENSMTMQVRVRDQAGEIMVETILDLHTIKH